MSRTLTYLIYTNRETIESIDVTRCYLEIDGDMKPESEGAVAYSDWIDGYRVPVDMGACAPAPLIQNIAESESGAGQNFIQFEVDVKSTTESEYSYFVEIRSDSTVHATSEKIDIGGGNTATFELYPSKDTTPCDIEVVVKEAGGGSNTPVLSQTYSRTSYDCS